MHGDIHVTGPARQCQSVLTHVSRGIGKEAMAALCTSLISIAAVGHRPHGAAPCLQKPGKHNASILATQVGAKSPQKFQVGNSPLMVLRFASM